MKPKLPSPAFAALTALAFASCTFDGDSAGRTDATSQGTLVATINANSGSGTKPASQLAGDPEGIVKLGGQLYYVKDRRATAVRGRERFAEGLHLESNGDVILQDGRRLKLGEGQMVTLAGELREAPPGIDLPRGGSGR